METKTKPLEGTPPPEKAVETNGPGNVANASAPALSTPSASATAPKFGGLRGGKPRKDGLVPGSPEAKEVDREKERIRKQKQRDDAKAAVDPAPLPAAAAAPVAGSPVPLANAPGPVVVPMVAGPLPWMASKLAPLCKRLVSTVEKICGLQISKFCTRAGIPSDITKDIEAEAAWNALAKTALEESLPELAAKYLNKTGVSAEYQPELVCATALADIALGHYRVLDRLEKLIAIREQQAKQQPQQIAKP